MKQDKIKSNTPIFIGIGILGFLIYAYFGWTSIGGWIYDFTLIEHQAPILFDLLDQIRPDILKGLIIMAVCFCIIAFFFILIYIIGYLTLVILIVSCIKLFKKLDI